MDHEIDAHPSMNLEMLRYNVAVFVLLEEQELCEAFGEEFLDYCVSVSRYLPKRFW